MAIEYGAPGLESRKPRGLGGAEALEEAYAELGRDRVWAVKTIALAAVAAVPAAGQIAVAGLGSCLAQDAREGGCGRPSIGRIAGHAIRSVPTCATFMALPAALMALGYLMGGEFTDGKPGGDALPAFGRWFSYGSAAFPLSDLSVAVMFMAALLAVVCGMAALVAVSASAGVSPVSRAREAGWLFRERSGELLAMAGRTLLLQGLGGVLSVALMVAGLLAAHAFFPSTPANITVYIICGLFASGAMALPATRMARAIGLMESEL